MNVNVGDVCLKVYSRLDLVDLQRTGAVAYFGLAAITPLPRLRVLMCLKPVWWSVVALVMLVPLLWCHKWGGKPAAWSVGLATAASVTAAMTELSSYPCMNSIDHVGTHQTTLNHAECIDSRNAHMVLSH